MACKQFSLHFKLTFASALIGLGICLPSLAWAKYRVFELAITNTQTGKVRVVTSTLDDLQYPTYKPVFKDEVVTIQDTWMCWQRSEGYQPLCPNPKASPSAR